jgi:hypothetical protein
VDGADLTKYNSVMDSEGWNVKVGLSAVVVSVPEATAGVMTVGEGTPHLPYGEFDPSRHRTLELALRSEVDALTGLQLGYVEQLYTFGNRHRATLGNDRNRMITIGYLALLSPSAAPVVPHSRWSDWYTFLPWEDHRKGRPEIIDSLLLPHLDRWAQQESNSEAYDLRLERIRVNFGHGRFPWDPEKVLPRFELLYEAGLVAESHRDWATRPEPERCELPISQKDMDDSLLGSVVSQTGVAMGHDHRRILASSLGRLRGKIGYRPVIFELMPPEFTLLRMQKVAEALSGVPLHKQNFRRLVIQGGLVKETGHTDNSSPGRPAALFRFRRSVLQERPAPGVGLPLVRR